MNRLAMLLIPLVLAACDSGTPPAPNAPPVPKPAADPAADLIRAYRDAHAKKSVDAFIALMHLDGAEPDTKTIFATSFQDDLSHELDDVSIVPPKADEPIEYEQNGKRYVPNLEVVGWLSVMFRGSTDGTQASQYLVGRRPDGAYRIATSRPK